MKCNQESTCPEGVECESCEHYLKDKCCVGVYNNCKVIVKPMVYDFMPVVIIVVPMHKHCPYWELDPQEHQDLHFVVSKVAKIMIAEFDNVFPNFFTGGNINNSKYGLKGVHAHVHVEARKKGDPDYNTFPGHKNKKMLSQEEIDERIKQWKFFMDK